MALVPIASGHRVVRPDHCPVSAPTVPQQRPGARPKIPKTLRALVWNTHIGEDRGTTKCLCGTTISQMTFECGHITPHALGGPTTVGNLYPVCGSCNRSMGTNNYATFALMVNGKIPRGMPVGDDIQCLVAPGATIQTGGATIAAFSPSLQGRLATKEAMRCSETWLSTPDDEWVLVRRPRKTAPTTSDMIYRVVGGGASILMRGMGGIVAYAWSKVRQ